MKKTVPIAVTIGNWNPTCYYFTIKRTGDEELIQRIICSPFFEITRDTYVHMIKGLNLEIYT